MLTASPLVLLVIPLAALTGIAALRVLLWTFRKFPAHFSPKSTTTDEADLQRIVSHSVKHTIYGTDSLLRDPSQTIYRTAQGHFIIPKKEETTKAVPLS